MGSPEEKICKEGKKLADKIDEKRKNNEKQKRKSTETIQKK